MGFRRCHIPPIIPEPGLQIEAAALEAVVLECLCSLGKGQDITFTLRPQFILVCKKPLSIYVYIYMDIAIDIDIDIDICMDIGTKIFCVVRRTYHTHI